MKLISLKMGRWSCYLLTLIAVNAFAADYSFDMQSTCHGFPRARIGSPKGTCVGVVATAENGLKRPRRILEVRPGYFLVTDMGGWAKNIGSLWSVEVLASGEARVKRLLQKLDHLHGLAMDSKGYIYMGERGRISRFHIDDQNISPVGVIENLPTEGKHPLTHMIFDHEDRLIVNVGAPTDQCLDDNKKPQYPCPQSEGQNPEAALYRYTLDQKGRVIHRELLARGLRNSMGLAVHPQSDVIIQAENNMDFKEEELPNEELNIITPGAHYGWPYCHGDQNLNPAYKRTLLNRKIPKIDCDKYQSPTALLPAHSAPLDMLFYQGDLFPKLTGKLLISFHGYRQYGHRLASVEINAQGAMEVGLEDFVNDWDAVEGLHPQGSPVGMTEASDGKIWFVEDKNKTVMFIARTDDVINDDSTSTVPSARRLRPLDQKSERHLKNLADNLFVPVCSSCHGSLSESNLELLHQGFLKDGFINLDRPLESEIYLRITGQGEGMQMPPGDEVSEDMINAMKSYLETIEPADEK